MHAVVAIVPTIIILYFTALASMAVMVVTDGDSIV